MLGVLIGMAAMSLHYESLRRALRAQRHEYQRATQAELNAIREAVLGDRAAIRMQSYKWGRADERKKGA